LTFSPAIKEQHLFLIVIIGNKIWWITMNDVANFFRI